MKKTRRRNKRAPAHTVRVPRADVQEAIAALDACEQLFELLKGPLNGDWDFPVNDLLVAAQDRIIVSARIRLHMALRDHIAAGADLAKRDARRRAR